MGKSTTEQKATSQDRGIIQGIGFKEFSAICDEYRIVETATKNLLEIANNPETKTRFKIDIYKWVVEMNIGKPKQMEILSSIDWSAGIFAHQQYGKANRCHCGTYRHLPGKYIRR